MHLIATAGCPSITLFSNDSNPAQCAPCGRWTRILQRAEPRRSAGRGGACGNCPPDGRYRASRQSRPTSSRTDGVPMPQRMWAILTIALGLTLAVLDGGIANVALPTIAREVNTSPANSIWVVNAYQLAVTISLLPLSSLGRDLRLPAYLPGGPGAVHDRLAGLRAVVLAADADHRAHAAGLRRRGDHERQQRPDPLHLSPPLARPRGRTERHRRIDRLGAGTVGCLGDPGRGAVAVAVRGERAAGRSWVRSSRCGRCR